jgi:2,4-dienoyl-CoA reductase-like NADH-dependent reductase (Old Yellow Enzyme family)
MMVMTASDISAAGRRKSCMPTFPKPLRPGYIRIDRQGDKMPEDYFVYETDAEFLADAKRLGVNVRRAADVGALFRPLTVGGLRIGNRLAIHPMEGCDGTLDGKPTELTIRRWDRFAAGGSKLIWGEAVAVTADGRANPRQLLMNAENEKPLADLLARARKVHQDLVGSTDDLVFVCQLTHSGRYSFAKPLIAMHDPGLDPITLVDKKAGTTVTPDYPVVTDDWLEALEDRYVEAADRAHRIGFQAVDIKQCHRYLLNELLAGRTREGRYGGSFENRTRFVRNVIAKIRARVPGVAVYSRIGVYDGVPYKPHPDTHVGIPRPYETPYRYGFGCEPMDPLRENLDEPLRLVRTLKDAGVGLLNISMGNPYANPHVGRPFELPPVDGYTTPEHPLLGCDRHFRITARLQKAFPDLPMVGSGYSWLQHLVGHVGAANIEDGNVAFVGVGRGAFAYPEWAKDLAAKGQMDRKRVCIAVSMCTALMRAKGNEMGQVPTGCVPRDKFYAPVYKEALKSLPPVPGKKK